MSTDPVAASNEGGSNSPLFSKSAIEDMVTIGIACLVASLVSGWSSVIESDLTGMRAEGLSVDRSVAHSCTDPASDVEGKTNLSTKLPVVD